MAEDGKIVYRVVIDDEQAIEQAEQSGDKAGKIFSEAAGSKLKSTAKAIGAAGLAAGTAVVAVGSTIAKETGKLAEYGDHIDKMSQKLGMSAEAYQEWDAILQHSGASIDSLEPTMKSLFKAAQDGSDAFTALGISQEEAAKMSQEDLFSATITALQNVTDENEKAAIAQELLGRGAQELAPLLNTSAEETEAMRQRVHELGGVLSDEAVKNAAAYQDTLQDMQTAMQGVSNQLISEFLPDITSIMGGITEIFSGDSEKGIGMVTDGLNAMLDKIVEALPDILKVGAEIVSNLLKGLIKNLPKIIETGIEILITLIEGIIEAIPELIAAGPHIIHSLINGILSHLPQLVSAGLRLLLAIGQGLLQALPQLLLMLPQIISELIAAFRNTDWKSIGSNIVNGVWEGIKSLWGSLVDSFRESVSNLWESAKRALGIASPSKKFKYIGEMTTEGTIEGIEDTQAEMTRTVTDVYGGMADSAQSALTRDLGSLEQNVSYNLTAAGKAPDTTIVVPLTLDGREIARATAWSMGEQLAWEEMA